MIRAAIYARYSSENQREASIEDQVEICRRYAERQGLTITEVFDDRAISGAHTNRPGFQSLLAAARQRRVNVIIVEALDRLTRRLSDVAQVFDELQFARVDLHAVNVGPVTTMHVGMLGTMAQMYLSDLKEKTKRGQLGRIRHGRAAAGKAFGYDVPADAEEAGLRTVNPIEAAVIVRIFEMFANGVSPRTIAHRLNEEGVPGPEGRPWGDTTVRGQKERGTGILNNELYIGQLVWNRCSYVKDPRTGKRVARPNSPDQWERSEVPHLRIVSDDLWRRVKRRQDDTAFQMGRDECGNALNRAHRRKFLLSGLLLCGCCGAGYTIVAAGRYGCAGRRSKGTCSNDRTITRLEIEQRILTALKDRLLTPDLVAEFTRAYQEEVYRMARQAATEDAERNSRLTAIQKKIDGLMRAIEDGLYQPSMKGRMEELEREKAALLDRGNAAGAGRLLSLHPNLSEAYRKRVDDLERLLESPEHRDEAMELIRSMIDKIVLSPRPQGPGVQAELHGDLARILTLCSAGGGQQKAPEAGLPGLSLSVVAGAGFEPTTFRL